MAAKTRVLIITYLFPPSGGVGVPRFVSYTRYLPEHGCDVSVLTVKNPSTPVYDPDLARQVPPETKVFRAFSPEVPYGLRDWIWARLRPTAHAAQPVGKADGARPLFIKRAAREIVQRLFCPDAQMLWVPFAIRAMNRIVKRERIDVAILNAPPFSCLNIAVALKKTHPEVKLIIDFRDEWIDNYLVEFDSAASEYKRRLAVRLEHAAIEAADFVSGITPSQMRQIRNRYPDQPDAKFISIPNGYDPDAFQNFRPRPHNTDRIVVTYLGTVYANVVYAPLWRYLEAVEELPDELRARIETRFVGRVAREAASLLERYRSTIRLMGFFPKREAVKFLEETDYLLTISSNPTTQGGKLFDYLASGKPILAVAPPDGDLAQLLRETRTGWCAAPDDRAAVRAMLEAAFRGTGGELPAFDPDWKAIRAYEWRNLVARMVELTGLG